MGRVVVSMAFWGFLWPFGGLCGPKWVLLWPRLWPGRLGPEAYKETNNEVSEMASGYDSVTVRAKVVPQC